MLILGRREGESIVIEGGVRIVVLSADRRGVRLGIEAPPDVRILRGEIVAQVERENQRATASGKEWLEVVPAHRRDVNPAVLASASAPALPPEA